MAKITEYGIISEASIEKLVPKVQKFIYEGWEPNGGATLAIDGQGSRFFMQTVVRSGAKNSLSNKKRSLNIKR